VSPGLARAALGRIAGAAFSLIGVAVLLQLMLRAAPGDPIDLLPDAEGQRAALEAAWGLDRSLLQVLIDVLQGRLGESLALRPGASVAALVAEASAASAPLLLGALPLSLLLAVPVARSGRGRAVAAALSATPIFLFAFGWVSLINELTFALMGAGLLSAPSWFALPDQPSALRTALAALSLAVASGNLSAVANHLLGERSRARASGWREALVARGEPTALPMLRNLLPGALALLGARSANLVGGLVVLEKVMLVPGAGAMLWDAALARDYPLALGLSLAAATAVVGLSLACELGRIALDPRLQGGA
jgi:peptide/nickel transport system permease protein